MSDASQPAPLMIEIDDVMHRTGVSAQSLIEFCRRWKVQELSLFGSVLRDDYNAESDIDVLVAPRLDAEWSLYEWIDMRDELARLFGRPVDLVSKNALRNPFRKQSILSTRRVVYAA